MKWYFVVITRDTATRRQSVLGAMTITMRAHDEEDALDRARGILFAANADVSKYAFTVDKL